MTDAERIITVAIVIPFFQRATGILGKAIKSVLSQNTSVRYLIIVVDDASPQPAQDEIDSIENGSEVCEVIRQVNQGAAAARNRGLEYASQLGAEYIAFLDSDDEWDVEHLSNAMSAMELGYDYYFGDFLPTNAGQTRFQKNSFLPTPHENISTNLFAYKGDLITDILAKNIVGTSTVVYRRSISPNLRFRRELANAGEDHVFWMSLSTFTQKIVFSSDVSARYGSGINIFASGRWGSDNAIRRIYYDMLFRQSLTKIFKMNKGQIKLVSRHIGRLRNELAQNILHKLINRKPKELEYWFKILRLDPITFLILPVYCVRYLIKLTVR
jgi:succinoglycan biosynthesis protein ExoW